MEVLAYLLILLAWVETFVRSLTWADDSVLRVIVVICGGLWTLVVLMRIIQLVFAKKIQPGGPRRD